jgi:hypothetical protein
MTSASMDGAGAIAVSSYDYSLPNATFLVDATTGAFVTVDNGNSRSAPSPVFADDALLVTTGSGRIYAYRRSGS